MPGREPALARARQPEQGDGRDEQQRQKPDQRSGPKPSLRPARRRKHLCGAAPAPGLCFNKVDFIAAGPKLEPQAVYRRIVAVMTVQRLAEPSDLDRSEEHTSELQSLMRISYAGFCLKKK